MNIGEKDLPLGVQGASALLLDAGQVPLCKDYFQAPFYSSARPACSRCLPSNSRREHYLKLSVLPSRRITQDLHGEESAFDASRGKNQRLLTPQLHVACAVRPALPGDVPHSPKRALG